MLSAFKRLSENEMRLFAQNGFHLARGLFDAQDVDDIRTAFQEEGDRRYAEALTQPGAIDSSDPLARYPRMMMPHRELDTRVGQLAMSAMLDPRIEDILHDLFGEQAIAAQSMFYFKPPGSRGQALHQDNFYLRVSPATCMAAWMAVDDADEENGGLVVVPGSHAGNVVCPQEADPQVSFTDAFVPVPEGLQEVPVTMKAGDVLFFNGSVIHGSYPNTSVDRSRRALIFHYVPETSREVSEWYQPLLSFDQRVVESIADATGGGPCGTEVDMPVLPAASMTSP